ncbi:dihydropteroate synthase [Limnochorda pilosa]|uniref:Dihydropteroate synthase n=1 Tax=Limnochorda pilosa TaxID=1555112 RepID=A0A0K2SPM3_LIMPI|nr:dihydropteroate synthase [Limnochorda pilosa]
MDRLRLGEHVLPLGRRTYVMGVLNVTPDSFSDGGQYLDAGAAVARGLEMAAEGADLIDVGGESTRPGAAPVSEAEELRRVVPVIRRLAREARVPISIDTYKARVAEAAVDAGARFLNDISAALFDPGMAPLAARSGLPVVVMHMLGEPRTMQQDPWYEDVVREVGAFFEERIQALERAGVRREQMILDPGLGFGKRFEDNLRLLGELGRFGSFGLPLLVGPSRKSFLGRILGTPPLDRVEGTLAAVVVAVLQGADMVRVHDVRAVDRARRVVDALVRPGDPWTSGEEATP